MNKIEVPRNQDDKNYKSCKDWITLDAPKDIEEKLRERNQTHFGQAHGKFPTVPPFSEWIDWGASTHVAELLLEGTFDAGEIDSLTKDLLRHMEKRTSLDDIPDELTTEQWVSKISSWPENTTTSPSGFHLTKSKALVAKHDLDLNTADGKALEIQRLQLIEWQVELLNLAIKNNYSYKRWQVIVNVMILKDPNNVKIHRLRVLHLYEHDYNMILAIKWRDLIQSANKKGTLNEGQFGSVPGKNAITPTIIEELQYKISRASKRPLLHMDYDATACYDRIILSLGSLIARGYGQHRNITIINANTLESAKYVLKTQLGVSESFYRHSNLVPIYGSGQGSGNSPGLWCCISSVSFDLYEEKAHGAFFQSPDGTLSVRIYMIGFVDDTSGSTNDFLLPKPAPMEHYTIKATEDAQRWNDILGLTAGALEDTKCSYHFLYYNFTLTGLAVLKGGTFDPKIIIQFNDNEQPTALKQLSAHTSHKTLGVRKNPAGNPNSLFAVVEEKNKIHSKLIARSPLDRIDAWTYYHAIYLPSITYSFPSSTLTDSQCNQLQIQVKQAVLPKYGFNRNTPNAVVYGHSDYAGVEMRTLSIEKGLSQLLSLITCVRSTGIPHKLAMIAISWAQLLAGTSTPIFQETSIKLPQLDPMVWIPAIRDFLNKINGSLEMAETFVPDLQRENDCFLMDDVVSGSYRPTEIKYISACRLYLGVTLMSDIATADGNEIRPEILLGSQPTVDTHKGLMPYQEKPNETAWKLWRRMLLKHTIGQTLCLSVTLGKWLATGEATHRNWRYYLDAGTEIVYMRKDQEYECLERINTHYVYNGKRTSLLPSSSFPVDLDLSSPEITFFSISICCVGTSKTPTSILPRIYCNIGRMGTTDLIRD